MPLTIAVELRNVSAMISLHGGATSGPAIQDGPGQEDIMDEWFIPAWSQHSEAITRPGEQTVVWGLKGAHSGPGLTILCSFEMCVSIRSSLLISRFAMQILKAAMTAVLMCAVEAIL